MQYKDVLGLSAMPPQSPSYGRGPFHYGDTESLLILYVSDADAIRQAVPEPLVPAFGNMVGFAIFNYRDSAFGPYTEAVQFIPCTFQGKSVNFVRELVLSKAEPIAAGREIWGFPKKSGEISLNVDDGDITGEVKFGGQDLVTATSTDLVNLTPIPAAAEAIARTLEATTWVSLKVIPSCDGKGYDALQLVAVNFADFKVESTYQNPATLHLVEQADCPVADLPVNLVLTSQHYKISKWTLPYGVTLWDYLANPEPPKD